MDAADRRFVLGYDPGGNGRHGLAILEVKQLDGGWAASGAVELAELADVNAVMKRVENATGLGQIVASGIDTLTAWSAQESGWRIADRRLREYYPDIANSVASPNSLYGAMSIGGALMLHWLAQRQDRGGLVTEAHPKVCYFALRHKLHPWAKEAERSQRADGWQWLKQQLGCDLPDHAFAAQEDHMFDALLGCLAALRGLNGQWTLDLHNLYDAGQATEVHPFGQTHYWWPDVG